MSSPIIFRSLKAGTDRAGTSIRQTHQRGTSWSHLRAHTESDDVRDIAWHKIRPDSLYVREREDHGDFEIIWCSESTPYDTFSTSEHPISKWELVKNTHMSICESARHGWYNYREYKSLEKLIKFKPRNALIFLSGMDTSADIQRVAFYNDVIFLDTIHPFEESPSKDILFFWKILSKSYEEAYKRSQDEKKKRVKRLRISYISLYTHESIDKKLNYFFKNRFRSR